MVTILARSWGEWIIEPLARFLGRLGLTPNAITVLGFLLTAAVAVVLATGQTQLAGGLLILTLGADAIDGALARMMNAVSRFGAFLDSTLDRWTEVFLFGALIWRFLQTDQDTGVMLAAAAMATSLLVSYTRARAEGVGLTCKAGLLTRFERLVIFIAGLIFNQIIWALWIITLLAGITAIQRIWVTWQADQATG
ncbi:MAG: CDP-alcohol phosphatidyltransferase family protein [Chloroflexi bacterium HGW-Chloroflexi-1]|nr:MAG: CDP-alcohol phosphatidyltransferase family protein [Chloroflexi bacterium HGW-Chloroflexi-1]